MNSDLEDAPATENSQLIRLRSDPSVASLLDMYDEHGCLPSRVFANSPSSPVKEGRAQTRRSGSTLRQLLGSPSDGEAVKKDILEDDISWADRYLRYEILSFLRRHKLR